MKYLALYLLIINALGFLIMHADKQKARKGLWRIPEATLFAIALMGGSLGCFMGMRLFRHKTKHLAFSLGLPIVLAVQIIALVFLISHA